MGETLGKLFVNPSTLPGGEHCGGNSTIYHHIKDHYGDAAEVLNCSQAGFGFVEVLFLTIIYAKILSWSSNLISDGSELLLLVPSFRGIVGSVVLPILGAVPDGAIVLFSGLGKDAQKQVAVGVGALAGSTIMLLTIPWFLAVLAGRVDLGPGGVATYKKPRGAPSSWKKLTTGAGTMHALLKTGIAVRSKIFINGKMMLGTALIYFVIQGPAFRMIHEHGQDDNKDNAHGEHDFALAGFLLCVVAFAAYLFYQVRYANHDDKVESVCKEAIASELLSASGFLAMELARMGRDEEETLLHNQDKLRDFLRPFYHRYDVNGDNKIDKLELKRLFDDMNERLTSDEFNALMTEMDKDQSGFIEFDEFVEAMGTYVQRAIKGDSVALARESLNVQSTPQAEEQSTNDDDDGDDEDEDADSDGEEEMPDEFENLSPAQQQRAILFKSAWMMGLGTIVVLLFSDPMVDVLSDLGDRMSIPPFYVAFVLAPMASNASELIAAYNYALKKTKKTITISFSTLVGAAIMNNTFCLGIFLLLVFAKKLAWTFSAETISVFVIQVLMFAFTQKQTHRLLDAVIVISLYPLSLLMVALLEGPGGLD
eukprot:m.110591 g.110591  ORF g.110591 m.110591 type:complete len:595 (+) comp22730_c0_seq3:52-1836(+)